MVIARALLGLAFFCAVSWLMSSDRRRVEPRIVVLGIPFLMRNFLGE